MLRRRLASIAATLAGWAFFLTLSSRARGGDSDPPQTTAELAAIRARLTPTTRPTRRLTLEAGGTLFLEARSLLEPSRLRGAPTEYEGLVTGVEAEPGVELHGRVDEIRFERRGDVVEVVLVYVITADPGARGTASIWATLKLRERRGLANTILTEPIEHEVIIVPPRPSERDLAADFWGYRFFLDQARARLELLEKAGLRGMTLEDEGQLPPTDRLSAEGVAQLWQLERARRKIWVAHRHLMAAATRSPDPRIAATARAFLKNLAKPPSERTGLPEVPLVDRPPPPEPEQKDKPAPPDPVSKTEEDGKLAPVAEYRPGSEGTLEAQPAAPPTPSLDDAAAPADLAQSEARPVLPAPGGLWLETRPETEEVPAGLSEGLEPVPADASDTDRLGRRFYLPAHPRGLLLDDPNIAHAGAVRASFAEVNRPEEASTWALFYSAQVGLTNDVGLEVTVPTQLVQLEVGDEAQSLYRLGNPMVAAKYRFHLPNLLGRRPAVTVRGRWGIAATPRNEIPASELFAEQFSLQPNFADLHAFLLEKTDVGAGASLSWKHAWLVLGAQVYGDYLFPTEVATDRSSFFALSYGLSLGALPFGRAVGGFLEARAVSLLGGPQRTEVFSYAGFRARLLDALEPALWLGVPFGSVTDVTGLQVGAEIRVSYDVRSIVELGGRRQALGR